MPYDPPNAVYALNSYLNKALQVNLGWVPIQYTTPENVTVTGLPIVPSQTQPQLIDAGKTFLVYSSAVQPTSWRVPALKSEVIVYRVWAETATEANKVANFIIDLFDDIDNTPDAVNSWLDKEQAGKNRDRHVTFAIIRPSLSEKAEPSETEDGWVSASVTIETSYTKKGQAPVTRFEYA